MRAMEKLAQQQAGKPKKGAAGKEKKRKRAVGRVSDSDSDSGDGGGGEETRVGAKSTAPAARESNGDGASASSHTQMLLEQFRTKLARCSSEPLGSSALDFQRRMDQLREDLSKDSVDAPPDCESGEANRRSSCEPGGSSDGESNRGERPPKRT